MKQYFWLIIMSVVFMAMLLITQCVQGPTASVETGPHSPESAISITTANADSLLGSKKCAVIEFYSVKCPICTSLVWVIDSLFQNFGDSVLIGANNTESDTLWKRFSINSVPTYIFYRDGAEISRRSFIKNRPEVYDTVVSLLKGIILGNVSPDTSDTITQPDTTTPRNYITLDSLTFDTTVLRSGRAAMVFFLYAGGSPCIYMDSVVKKIAPAYENKAIIAKVHAWEQRTLSERYGINSVPRFLFFKDSVLVEQKSSMVAAETLRTTLDNILLPAARPVTVE